MMMSNVLRRIYTGFTTGAIGGFVTYYLLTDRETEWVADCQCYAVPIHGKPLAVSAVVAVIVFLTTTRVMYVSNRKGK
jgi:hypothetical protein